MRCQTLPTSDPILKNSAFDLMTDPEMWLPCNQTKRLFFNDFCWLWDFVPKYPGFVPVTTEGAAMLRAFRRPLVRNPR